VVTADAVLKGKPGKTGSIPQAIFPLFFKKAIVTATVNVLPLQHRFWKEL
jgi:hypothetical protein